MPQQKHQQLERCATGTVQQQTIYCLSSVKNQTVIHVIVSALQINQTLLGRVRSRNMKAT